MLSRSNSTLTSKPFTTSNRRNQGDPSSVSVRYDYSSAYFENDGLEAELEGKRYFLQRRKYRASIDGEEYLKKEKENAERLLSLKEKVNKRDPNESSNKISKFTVHDSSKQEKEFGTKLSREDRHDHLGTPVLRNSSCAKQINPSDNVTETDTETNDANAQSDEVSDTLSIEQQKQSENDHKEGDKPKLMNNLTMFLLAFQKFKVSSSTQDQLEKQKRQNRKDEYVNDKGKKPSHLIESGVKSVQHYTNPDSLREFKRKRSISAVQSYSGNAYDSKKISNDETVTRKMKKRPATVPANSERHLRPKPVSETSFDSPVYGINVQKDFSRSRRKLAEISRLEQDLKYKYVNKYEERRKRLLADCKDTTSLDERIQKFLTKVDEFKQSGKPESKLEKILRRSKSAYIFRGTDDD